VERFSCLSSIVVSLLAAIGCGSSATSATGDGGPLDAAVMADAAVTADAAVMADAAVQGDAGEIVDAMGDAGGDIPDTTPPGPVTDLRPRPGPRKIGLTWTNPHDDDFETVAIRWSVVAMPESPDNGVPVEIRPGDQAVVFSATNGLTYFIAAFAIDRAGNVSQRAEAVTIPRAPWRSGPDLPATRFKHSATAFADSIFVAGRPFGQDAPFLIEYDPVRDRWINCESGCAQPPQSSLRIQHAAVRVEDRLLLFAGCIGEGGACSSGYLGYRPIEYDRSQRVWTNCGDAGCTDARLTHGDVHHVAEYVGGKVYVTGGTLDPPRSRLEEYDPAANAWTNCGAGPDDTACADAPAALRRAKISSLVIGGEIHVVGGEPWDVLADPTNRADHLVYSPASNRWTRLPDFPGAHAYLVGIIAGAPYAIGGTKATGLSDPFMYRWDGAKWIKGVEPLPFEFSIDGVPDTGRAVWGGEAYFFGGTHSDRVAIYNPLYDW
jgi:hypothetical protein